MQVGAITVSTLPDGSLTWTGPLAIDADGANGQAGKPPAYAPSNIPHLDALANAGHPGNWFGLVTDTGQPTGTPIEQRASDPCPGAYLSATALVDASKSVHDPHRYVDAATVPYISVPPELLHAGVHKGDVCRVEHNGAACAAVVADVGPHGKLGEGSVALAEALGIPSSPRNGGASGGVTFRLWPGSTKGWPRTCEDVSAQVDALAV